MSTKEVRRMRNVDIDMIPRLLFCRMPVLASYLVLVQLAAYGLGIPEMRPRKPALR